MQAPVTPLLGELLQSAARRYPHHDAIVFPDHRLNYAAFEDESHTIARALLARGVQPGDHIGILATNRPEYLPLLFACVLIGAVAVLLNARFRTQELRHVVRHCDLKWVVTGNLSAVPNAERLLEALPELMQDSEPNSLAGDAAPKLEHLITLDETPRGPFEPWHDFLDSAEDVTEQDLIRITAAVDPMSTALIMFTSGTTSMPKGCALNHHSVFLTSAAMRDRLSVVHQDVMWDPLPLFHMASILPLFALMHEAGTFLTDHTVNIDRAVEQIHNEQATFLYPAFPAIMADLIAHRDLKPETLRRIRLINNVAHTEVLEANMAAMPLATHISAYGMTELSGIASHTDPGDPAEDRARNCGQPYPGVEVSIRDPGTNQPVDEGCQGEICVKGFSVFQGYYNQPEENAKAFDADGWFHTGDMGSLDERGRICFHGRLKDMLKVGGENVSPLEIEAWLSTHPGIAMAQVIGAPDERLQEVPVAFIELHPDASVTEADIVAYCAGQIASYKVPRRVIFVSEWPMSATKIQKAALREWL